MREIRESGSLTHGTVAYFHFILDTYHIEDGDCTVRDVRLEQHDDIVAKGVWDCISTCPITLATMHRPVVASDGFTYEMQALVRHLQKEPALSPMTREPLTLSLTFNRELEQKEQRLWDLTQAITARLRRRRTRRTVV